MHAGDPSFLGWLTVAVYFLAAFLCAVCAWRAGRNISPELRLQHRLIWAALAAVLLLLGLNKQLDLQSQLIPYGRDLVQSLGWADLSQTLQLVLVWGMAAGAVVSLLLLAWWMRRLWRYYWMLLLGLLFLARFIIVRLATFLGVSLPELSKYFGGLGLHLNYLLEITGTAVIALAALYNLRRGT
jgi:hypothetical protein